MENKSLYKFEGSPHGWLVYQREDVVRNERFISLLQEGAWKRGHKLSVKLLEELDWQVAINSKDETDVLPDYVVNRSVSPWLNETVEMAGIPIFNSPLLARVANDKRLAHAFFQKKNIPMLPSVAITKEKLLLLEGEGLPFSYPVVIKDPLGRGGSGVRFARSEKELMACISELGADNLLLQPLCGTPGKDLRVYIVGNAVVGAVLRESSRPEELRANISTGGVSRFYELNEIEKSLVETICNGLRIDFAGIDFIFDEKGQLLFNEMEDAVGCRSLYMNSDIDIADVFMEYVHRKLFECTCNK